MDRKDFHNSDKVYQKGDRVCCIGGGLHIECTVIEESTNWNDVKVLDPITEREIWISRSQIDHDKQYYRDKALKELGI
jgi:CMP-2-keto-3-deoxyoctulosonic acid synthetase